MTVKACEFARRVTAGLAVHKTYGKHVKSSDLDDGWMTYGSYCPSSVFQSYLAKGRMVIKG